MSGSRRVRTSAGPASLLAMVLAAVVLVWSPHAGSQSVEEMAKREGKLIAYGSLESETMEAVVKAFTQRYGVGVDYWRASSSKVLDRVLTKSRAGKPTFDVALTNQGPMVLLKKQGAFARYLSPQNANFPRSLKDPENVLSPVYREVIVGILYNTRLVRPEDAPKSLEDLLNPKWRGKWVIPDPSQHFTTAEWLRSLEKLYGKDWLSFVKQLAATRPILVESFIPSAQKIISGEARAGITYLKYVYIYGKNGAPLDYVRLPKMLAEGHNVAIAARAPHPNAAKLFEDFLISRTGMDIMAKQGEFVAVNGIFPPIKDADKVNTVLMTELSDTEFNRWAGEFRAIFAVK